MQAILFAESFSNKFKPMSCERAKCLFPIANVPLLLYSLEFLANSNVTQVILVSTKDSRVFKPVIETIKAAHSSKTNRLQITPFKLVNANSVASALREVNDSQVQLKEDFIIMQGDIVTNADL
jgi:translation initiation factor eIF-2B subunit epsilon